MDIKTVDDICERLNLLRDLAGDDEAAHAEEDKIREDVLKAIARGAPNANILALTALRTSEVEFARWYA